MYQNIPSETSIRLCKTPMFSPPFAPLFTFIDGGWHHCGEHYHIIREHGFKGYMFFFTLSNGGTVKIGRQIFKIPAMSMTVLPPHIYHEYFTSAGQEWEFYWLHIAEENIPMIEQLIKYHGYILKCMHMDKIIMLMEDLFPDRFTPADAFYTLKTSQTIASVLHIIQEELYESYTDSEASDKVITEVIHEIETNYCQDLDISGIAAEHFISAQHLIRKFRQVTKITPYAYLKKYRLLKAGELLEYSGLSIKEIAAQTGFKDVSNFIYQFRREYGISPGNYRKIRGH